MSYIKRGWARLRGKDNPNWKGGLPRCEVCNEELVNRYAKTCLKHRKRRTPKERVIHNGYYLIYLPNHPHAGSNGYIREHRVIMEKKIGRILRKGEIVHHMNHVATDNRPENLMLMTAKKHLKLHHLGKKYKK